MNWYKDLAPEQQKEFEEWWLMFSFSPAHITDDNAKRVAHEAWKAATQTAGNKSEDQAAIRRVFERELT